MIQPPTPSYTLCFASALVIHSSVWLVGLVPLKTEATFFVAPSDDFSVELIETSDEPVPPVVSEPTPPPVAMVQPEPAPAPVPEPEPLPEPEPPKEVEKPRDLTPPKPPAPPAQATPPPQPAPVASKPMAKVKARTNPDYYRNPPPPYPEAARRAGVEGLVLLRVKVDTKGRAAEVTIRTGSGSAILDRAARNAVRRWHFQPARIGDLAVEDVVDVPIRFSLSEAT